MSRIMHLLAVVKYRINDVVKEEPRLVAVTATTDDTERDLIMKAHNAVLKTFERYYPKGSMLLSLLVMETIDGTDPVKEKDWDWDWPESLPESSGPEKSIGGATADGLTVDANVVIGTAAADGSNIVVTLDSDSHQENGKKSYPIPGDLCVFEDETVGHVNAKNTDVDGAHTVTIKPVNSDQDVITAAIPGSTITFYRTVFGEASDTPQSRVSESSGESVEEGQGGETKPKDDPKE